MRSARDFSTYDEALHYAQSKGASYILPAKPATIDDELVPEPYLFTRTADGYEYAVQQLYKRRGKYHLAYVRKQPAVPLDAVPIEKALGRENPYDPEDDATAGNFMLVMGGCAVVGTAMYFLFRKGGPFGEPA